MKNIYFAFLIILILGLLGWYLLPTFLAQSITSEKPSSVVPEEIKEEVDNLPEKLQEANLTTSRMIEIVDGVSNREIMEMYERMKASRPESVEQVGELLLQDLEISSAEKNSLETFLNQNLTIEDVNAMMKELENNEQMLQFYIPVIKQTIVKVLEQKEQEATRITQ